MSQRRFIEAQQGLPVREVVRQDIYDTKVLPQGGIASLTFFTQPTAGMINSNMVGQGMLARPKEFYCLGIAIQVFPGWTADMDDGITDTWAAYKKKIYEGGYVYFWVGDKLYTTSPLKRFPEGTGNAGMGTGGEDNNTILFCNGLQDINHYWETCVHNVGNMKKKPIHIMFQQSFSVVVTWPTQATANPGFGTGLDARIRVYLRGYLWREVQ